MNRPLKNIEIGDGISFYSILDDRFKTNRITINFVTELDAETVTVNALLPQLLRKGFEGCEDFTSLNRKLEELYGASLDAEIQKRGDSQILSLSIVTVDDRYALKGEPLTAKAAEILCSMVLHPATENGGFLEKYVELEKTALIDTIEAEINEKRIYAINNMLRTMCMGEPCGLPKYGYKDRVAEITPSGALAQYNKLLKTARIIIMFTGGGNDENAVSVFRQAFGSLERSFTRSDKPAPHACTRRDVIEKTDRMTVNQSKMVLGFANGVSAENKQIPAIRLMSAVLGGTPSAKLFVNVREKMSLCYYCAARYDTIKGIMTIDCGVENDNIEKARKAILAQLDTIRNGEITDDELRNALLSLQNAYATLYESDVTIENFYLNQLIAGGCSTPDEEREKLGKVSKEDIVNAAKGMNLEVVYVLTGDENGDGEEEN